MGVTCLPDMAGPVWLVDQTRFRHLNHPLVPFYRQYIGNCFAIVYVHSEGEVIAVVNNIIFDNCIIEWNVSDQFQVFLDMTLYFDENQKLQHMPYHKALFPPRKNSMDISPPPQCEKRDIYWWNVPASHTW